MVSDELIIYIEHNFDEYELEEDDVLRIICPTGYDIVIEKNDDKYSVFADLSVEYNHPIAEYDNSLLRIIYVLWVSKNNTDLPQYMSEMFGYFNVCPDDVKLIKMINSLYLDDDLEENLKYEDIVYIKTYYPEVYQLYETYKEIYEGDLLDEFSDEIWNPITANDKVSERFSFDNNDKVYINNERTMLCGVGEDTFNKITNVFGEPSTYVKEDYSGLKYYLCKTSKTKNVYSAKLVNTLNSVFNNMTIPSYCGIDYMVNENNIFFVKSGSAWGIVLPIQIDFEECVFEERNTLFYHLNCLKNLIPEEKTPLFYNLANISFSEFENMCYDFLIELGFKNLKIRGKSTTPDGGVDIEGYEEYETAIGMEKRYWLIQCKHTKAQINRKDISELDDLLSEFGADKFGIFYSGIFTPATLDRIKMKSFVHTWDLNQISFLLMKHPKVSKKYFGI